MGAAPSSCQLLAYDSSWHSRVASLCFLDSMQGQVPRDSDDANLPSDVAILILNQLDAASLQSLAHCCTELSATASFVSKCFDESCFQRLCTVRGWSFEPFGNVGIHLEPGRRSSAACPSWLGPRLGERLRRDHYHHMTRGVVAKCYDALGPLDESRSRFRQRPSWRRLFFAHVRHGIADDAPLISAADVAQQRKLRSLQAYLYAEGWQDLAPGQTHMLEHTIEHALDGRIEL